MYSLKPLVTICCITYNHENFIREAIDSFLMQKTNFPIEIIIHDDASTDNTANIIKEYQAKHPNLIKPIFQTQNQYSLRGFGFFSDMFEKAEGKYIAICEGDDYWTDPLKLQKQVDFLETNPDFAICFHKVKIWEEGQLKDDYITSVTSVSTTILDLAKGNYIHTPSCLFRNNTAKILGANFHASPLGDYYIHMMNAQYGNIFYIDEAMAVYRVHSNSTFSSQSSTYRIAKTLEAIEAIYKDLQIQEVEVRQQLIDTHIRFTIYIYDQLLSTTDLKNTIATFYPHEYRLRLIGNLINSEEKTKNLEDKIESIRWLTRMLASRIKKRIFKLFTQKETST
ncbi:glycosyltransferase [Dolichospermum sp. UHCC 0259]|uniref:glycosyltransferase family 2 protein n=1 Tax=Dolichospermum sp. UHCC 0259 TaxID=2590010 RepID=UPI0014484172|nr:glycosyltransferase [Dolichospermum sp. UHCC 0259]MTJ50312.1 glycosyltransferase [Dolichospermum sp. UHCC 0259]